MLVAAGPGGQNAAPDLMAAVSPELPMLLDAPMAAIPHRRPIRFGKVLTRP